MQGCKKIPAQLPQLAYITVDQKQSFNREMNNALWIILVYLTSKRLTTCSPHMSPVWVW